MIKIGHRGAAGYAPENTLFSFEKAIELGVDMIEFDVRLCASGEIIVMHDAKINRTTDGKGVLSKLTLNQIKQLKTKEGHQIPTLSEAIEFVGRRVPLNIEIKDKELYEKIIELLNGFIDSGKYKPSDFLVSSFHFNELINFRKKEKNIPIAMIYKKLPVNFSDHISALNPEIVNLNYKSVDKDIINKIHSFGKKIYVWTVNKYKDMLKLKSMNIDGLFSDYPDKL